MYLRSLEPQLSEDYPPPSQIISVVFSCDLKLSLMLIRLYTRCLFPLSGVIMDDDECKIDENGHLGEEKGQVCNLACCFVEGSSLLQGYLLFEFCLVHFALLATTEGKTA